MSRESRWYDLARREREDTREQAPQLAAQATELAFKALSNQNADARVAFWKRVQETIVKEAQSAPDTDCKEAAEALARICFKIGHAADGHP